MLVLHSFQPQIAVSDNLYTRYYAPPLMLVAGLHDVGHEDVTAGRGAFSLRSFNKALQLFLVI